MFEFCIVSLFDSLTTDKYLSLGFSVDFMYTHVFYVFYVDFMWLLCMRILFYVWMYTFSCVLHAIMSGSLLLPL